MKGLSVGGGGWRMPTRAELKGLYHKGMGSRNIPAEFKTIGWWVWSGELDSSTTAWFFHFNFGKDRITARNISHNDRAFAVRSRK